MVGCQKFLYTSGEKDKFLSIHLEAGQIWTAAALVCSLYFPKIISRYISIYLIIETLATNGQARCFDRILKRA